MKWCANLHQLFPCECNWVCTRIEITLDCLFEAMKKNQVSLRSGGIRGASFVVLYAALACAACLLAVPRSKSLFSSVQFRQQNVGKKTVNSVCCVWVYVSLNSRKFFIFFQTQIITNENGIHPNAVCIPETSTQWESFQSSRWSQWSRRIFLAASMVPCAMCPRNTFWSNDMFHIVKENSIG